MEGIVRARAFFQFSDLRLKTNIEDLVDAVNLIKQLDGKTYYWKDGAPVDSATPGRRVIGLIAQEVQRVLPELVQEDENGILSVSYTELIPILIEAFKQQLSEYQNDKEDTKRHLEYLHRQLEVLSLKHEGLASSVSPLLKPTIAQVRDPFKVAIFFY